MKQTMRIVVLAAILVAVVNGMAIEQSVAAAAAVPLRVDTENYVRAITDLTLNGSIVQAGGIGKFYFVRNLIPVTAPQQAIVRPNRDTLYAFAVLDLKEQVTIDLPPVSDRYLSLHGITNDQYTFAVIYPHRNAVTKVTLKYCDPESKDYKKCINQHHGFENFDPFSWLPFDRHVTRISDTRHVYVLIRIFLNPSVTGDLEEVNAIQDQLKITQTSPGSFDCPLWDRVSLQQVASAYINLGKFIPNNAVVNDWKGEISDVLQNVGTATGWGGLPPEHALYKSEAPVNATLAQVYKLTIPASGVPYNPDRFGFWSLSVYNQAGYFQPNLNQSFSVNSATAIKEGNGNIDIYFSSTKTATMNNWIFTGFPNWNYMWRIYMPDDGATEWTYPKLELVQ